jgi:hypothetical protein
VVSAGGSGELPFHVTADGAEHGGVCPAGELDRRVADRADSSGNEHDAPAQGVRMETSWAVLRDGQRAVRGGAGNPDAGAELEVRGIGQREDASRWDDGVFLGGAARRATVAGEGDPDAVADTEADDAGAELVDNAGAVVVGNRRFSECAAGCAAARLPVGWVHARDEHADPQLAFCWLGKRSLHELEYGWIAGTRVGDRPHGV